MAYYVYILESLQDGSYYIGYTNDLQQRLEKHNRPHKGHTGKKRPWKVVYHEQYEEKSEAIKREKALKKIRSRKVYQELIRSSNEHEQGDQNTCPESSGRLRDTPSGPPSQHES